MTQAEITRHDDAAHRRFPALLAGWALAFSLSACSQVPDWADPTDWFEGQEPPSKVAQAEGQLNYAQTAAFPSVVSVPDVAPRVTSPSARAELLENLSADRANAQYSDERLVGDTSSAAGIQAAAAPAAPQIAQRVAATTAPAPEPAPEPASTQIAHATQPRFQFPQFQGGAGVAQPAPAGASQLAAIIYFRHGSAALDAQDRQILRDIAALHRLRGGKIRVIGHASAHTGTVTQVKHRLANFEISLQRANAVVAGLISLGVAREAVLGEAKGDAQPVYHEFMPTGEAGNRRTEIFLEY